MAGTWGRIVGCAALVWAATASSSSAWDARGHRVVALIAYHNLTPAARAKIDTLVTEARDDPALKAGLQKITSGSDRDAGALGPIGEADATFAGWSTWADRYRVYHRETVAWHFVDLEIDKPDLKTACPALASVTKLGPAPKDECVVSALYRQAAAVGNPKTSKIDRIVALRFVIHLVGDLHQPLHVSDNRDNGGNCVRVAVTGAVDVTSLHAYWDTYTVEALGSSPEDIATKLETSPLYRSFGAAVAAETIEGDKLFTGWAEQWALQSHELARQYIYGERRLPRCGDEARPIRLTSSEVGAAKAVTSIQLYRAGLRLAVLLNALLA